MRRRSTYVAPSPWERVWTWWGRAGLLFGGVTATSVALGRRR